MPKLNLVDKAFWLKKLPLFANLELDLLLPIADKLGAIRVKEKEPVFWANEDALRLYFILEGEIEILKNGIKKATLGPQEFFGDEAIFSDGPHAYDAISKTDSILLTLSRTHLFTIIHECPTVAVALLQVYASPTSYRTR